MRKGIFSSEYGLNGSVRSRLLLRRILADQRILTDQRVLSIRNGL